MRTKTVTADQRPAEVRRTSLALFESRLFAAAAAGFHQPPFLSVTDWAAQHRILQGAESGRYNPDRCKYQAEIQDCFNDPAVREVSWMSAERIGKSTVASNILAFIIDREPQDCLFVMPSRESVGDYLKDEVQPMVRSSPVLLKKVSAGKIATGKTANIRRQTFLGGHVAFVGAGSPSPLAFRTCRTIFLDEIDKYRSLRGEGDADALASKRISTFGDDSKIFRFSKPTLEGESRIERHFLRGSQAEYFISCPGCGEFQILAWALLRFDDVTMRCSSCNEFFSQDDWQSSPAEWRHAVDNPHHKSFRCSGLVSPLLRWSMLIEDFKAAAHALEGGDPSVMEVFENSRLGKTYSGRVDKIDPGELYGRREVF